MCLQCGRCDKVHEWNVDDAIDAVEDLGFYAKKQ